MKTPCPFWPASKLVTLSPWAQSSSHDRNLYLDGSAGAFGHKTMPAFPCQYFFCNYVFMKRFK
jgi:hypothetical protein